MNRSTRGSNQKNIQDMNRMLLLNLLRKEGTCTRAHLVNLSQLKQATMTNVVSDFTGWGLAKEVRLLVENRGRRSIGTSINNDDFGVLAIRLARKNYTVGIFNLSGRLLDKKRVELDVNQSPRATFEVIIHEVGELIRSSEPRKIIATGTAISGPYNKKRGRIELMTDISGWNETPIQEKLQDIFKIPVFLEWDANTGALAQYWHNDEGRKNGVVVYIAVGQGVGVGIINNGELLKGCIGVAGEAGHTSICCNGPRCACGDYGCLENYRSSIAFTKEVSCVLRPEIEYNFRRVSQPLRDGDQVVTDIFLDACDKLSIRIVNIINSFNPSVIVIGDEMSHILPPVTLERAKSNAKGRVLPEIYVNMNITVSVVSNDSTAHGVTIVAMNDIFNHPLTCFENNQRGD